MASQQRSRPRRTRAPRHEYVAPVLDPTWRSPYEPSPAERHEHERAVRSFGVRRRLPQTVAVAVVCLGLIVVGVLVQPLVVIAAVVVAGLYAWDLSRAHRRDVQRGRTLGAALLAALPAAGGAVDRERLVVVVERLAATFGVTDISTYVVGDSTYNAALVPDGSRLSLFVTSALMSDFELIEVEGVVAHCLAHQRLGQLERESIAATLSIGDDARARLAGIGGAYRADEVAAAVIRYPLGLAAALRRCAEQSVAPDSFFATPNYRQWRWVFFDRWSDRATPDLADLDDPTLRARALEEW